MRRALIPAVVVVALTVAWSSGGSTSDARRQDDASPFASPAVAPLGTPVVDLFGCIFLDDAATPVPGGPNQRLFTQRMVIPSGGSLTGQPIDDLSRWPADVLITVQAPEGSGLSLRFEGGTVFFWDEGRCEAQTQIGCTNTCKKLENETGTLELDRDDTIFISRQTAYNIVNFSDEEAVLWAAVITDDVSNCPPCWTWP